MNDSTLCLLIRTWLHAEILLGYKKVRFGGRVDPGETILAATVCALAEEAGIGVDEADLVRMGHLTFEFPARPT